MTTFDELSCPIVDALDQIGPKWSLLIIRNAMMGTRRFNEFQCSLGIAKNMLATRLNQLVEFDIFQKVPSAQGSAHAAYELTAKGHDLVPVLIALAQWSENWADNEGSSRFKLIDRGTAKEIPRLWPKTADLQPIPLKNIVFERGT